VFGEEDTGAVTILAAHHHVSGGVVVHISTGFTGKGSIDLVDAFMGGVAETKACRAGDTVATVRDKELGSGVAASTHIEDAWGGVSGNGGTPGARQGEETKVVPGEGNEGAGLDDVGVEPEGSDHHAGLLGASSDKVDMAGSRGGEVVGACHGRMAGGTQVEAGSREDSTHKHRLNLLSGGFSKSGGRRSRGICKCSSRGREEASDGSKGGDGGAEVASEEVISGISVLTKGVLAVWLRKEGIVLGSTDRGEEG
jgi:hypothetical protein